MKTDLPVGNAAAQAALEEERTHLLHRIASFERAERLDIKVLQGGGRPKRPCVVCGKNLVSMLDRTKADLPVDTIVMNVRKCTEHNICVDDASVIICGTCVQHIVDVHAAQKD